MTRSNDGFSLIEALISIAIIIGSLSVATSLILKGNQLVKGLEVVTGITMIRSNIYNIVSSDLAWRSTIDNAAALSCVNNATDCTAAGGQFVLYTPDGAVYFDPTNAQNGFDLKGNPCANYDAVNGSLSCPFRVIPTWTPICAAADCAVGDVLLQLSFAFQVSLPQSARYPVNENRFNMQILRNRL